MKYTYIILGDPTPLGKIRDDHRRTYDQQHKNKAHCIRTIANQHQDQPPITGPIHIDIHFYMPLPQKGTSKLDMPHDGRPNLTDMVTYIERCAKGILYPNNCIIASITTTKRY